MTERYDELARARDAYARKMYRPALNILREFRGRMIREGRWTQAASEIYAALYKVITQEEGKK